MVSISQMTIFWITFDQYIFRDMTFSHRLIRLNSLQISCRKLTAWQGTLVRYRYITPLFSPHIRLPSFSSHIMIWEADGGGHTEQKYRATAWASYQIRKIAGCTCAGDAGNIFPAADFKGNHQLAIPAWITARASCTCRDACRDR